MFLIGIVDENEQERASLKSCIEAYFAQSKEQCVIHEFSDGVAFIQSQEKYHMIFLEAQIKEMDGIEAAKFFRMVNKEGEIVFVTHALGMAVRGYEVDAADFLIKPVTEHAAARVLDKLIKKIDLSMSRLLGLRTSKGIYTLAPNDILYIEVYDHDLIYHTVYGEYVVRGNLGEVYKKLEKYYFIQCSRSYLVNMRHIRHIVKESVWVGDEEIRISKSRQKEMEQRFLAYLGECIN